MDRIRVVIMGAAGRDFHNFNVAFRNDPGSEVVAFTAAQIPNIEDRTYPPDLAGPLYPAGIRIVPESDLAAIIEDKSVDEVVFSYSDVSHEEVMHKASLALSRGAGFRFLGPRATMLAARKPVISVCAVRTGSGKSPVARRLAALLTRRGHRVAVMRHPMPYGDLSRQAVQRFTRLEDLDRHDCTIEEREEYEPHIEQGHAVYAGVDYERILHLAEQESDVILWDGGNNDVSFIRPDLEIVVFDPHRAGDERSYFPGEVNLFRADVALINKVDTATPDQVERVRDRIRRFNPDASIVRAAMPVTADDPAAIRDRRVLVVEDGPTLTHGGMTFGAGFLAARKFGASELVDPRPYAVGSVRDTLENYPGLRNVLPAMGYGSRQIAELEETIRRTPCDLVLVATPADLRRVVKLDRPSVRVTYEVREEGRPNLEDVVETFFRERDSCASVSSSPSADTP